MKQLILIISFLLSGFFAAGQQTLTLQEFVSIVRGFHPIAKQAALGVEIAKAQVTSARGAFDPKLQNIISRKEFGGLLYYDENISELKIPTWYGVEVVAGIQSLEGQRTSTPETKGNSSYFGVSIPVAKGLLIDSRRAALQQAKIYQGLSSQEQRAMVNDLLHDAVRAYWKWWQQVQLQQLILQAIQNAEQRLRLVKTAFQLGERPAIDSVEALAQLQSLQISAQEIELALANAQLDVNTYLWQDNGEPYSISASTVPQPAAVERLQELPIEQLMQQVLDHPDLLQNEAKLKALEVEKRLKFQSLLPTIDLKYHQLSGSHSMSKLFTTPWLDDNYLYGVAVSIPLRLSEGRGEYREAKFKVEQVKLRQAGKQLTLQNKLQQYYNEWTGIRMQIKLQEQAVQSYSALLKGEEIKYATGESSLFLVNSRELKKLEAQQKLVELQSKEQMAAAGTLWATGILSN